MGSGPHASTQCLWSPLPRGGASYTEFDCVTLLGML